MKFKNYLLILSILFVVLIGISSVTAMDNADGVNDTLTADSSEVMLEVTEENNLDDENLGVCSDEILSAPQTIVVDEVELNHNEMGSSGTIQKAIDGANAGDTLIINGRSYVHCHFVVYKKLTIISNVRTTMSPCNSNTAGSGHLGIFYVSPEASGTIIEGFTLNSDVYNSEDYGILVSGASDVIIRNCKVTDGGGADAIRVENAKNTVLQNVTVLNGVNGIRLKNSEGITVKESNIRSSSHGIYIINSTKSLIIDNNLADNKIAGVTVDGTSQFSTITFNNITNNDFGVNLLSSNQIDISNNYLAFNNKYGVYVDCEVVKINIVGNFFNQNKLNEVFNTDNAKNLWQVGGEYMEFINNNYMIGVGERAVYRSYGGGVFLRYVFEINENVDCPVIYFTYEQTQWSRSGNYELQLSEIKQIKNGVYSISIVDENGNVAEGLSSVPVTFYLNKAGSSSTPQGGDTYKTVMMKDGTATVMFYTDEFKESGNVITAVVPTPGTQIDSKVSKTFVVSDDSIPSVMLNTSIKVNGFETYPNSNQQFTATLLDSNSNAIQGETLSFTINAKKYDVVTDDKGQAKIKISESKTGTYVVYVEYGAKQTVEYYASNAQATVVVKSSKTAIGSSNLNMIPKKAEYYSITLKDASGKVLPNQKIIFKVNGKTYTKTTNARGIAKVKLKFNKNKKTYKITTIYKGNSQYKSSSKTNKLIVKYSSKKAKLSAPKITIPPKTSTKYTVSLKDINNKGIAKQKVIIKINGKKYTKKTNKNGLITIKVKFSKFKTYKVSASYKGSKIYKKASSRGSIKVAKTTTQITAPTITMLPKETKTYTVTLKANNKGLSKQKLTIKINGETYTKTTNNNGQAAVNINFVNENTYQVNVNYKGTGIFKASSATGKVIISKISTQIESYDKTYSKDMQKDYQITLKDASGNAIANQAIKFSVNGQSYSKTTDVDGKTSVNLSDLSVGSFDIVTTFEGNDKYAAVSKTNKLNISNQSNVIFVDADLPNSEIQKIIDNSFNGSNIEFLGDYYFNISLNIDKSLNILSNDMTILNAKLNSPVFTISSNNVNVSGFSIKGNSCDGIVIKNAKNITIENNYISNTLEESKIPSYVDGLINMPGYGVSISNSSLISIFKNYISVFESGIFAENSNKVTYLNNTLRENNYGIKYGYGVSNSLVKYNEITECVGLYIMTVPEGPSGYGIYLNNSAVNVTINNNHIYSNHLGISVDANFSTGIVITQNTITDNVLEGIRFNAGYDLAENATEPHVTDNAIYRNARGPSMMILGELSANPEGIYGAGLYNDSAKLQLEANWYGTNQIITWDYDTGNVGYGTMCPRINTTEIKFNNITYDNGSYSVVFYKNGVVASNLPKFDMYATLNRGTDKQVEFVFDVVNGVGTFSFNAANYNVTNNIIEISVGSLIYSTSRVFKVTSSYIVPESEIKI